jgi:membrane protein DedA with SNARE-associated domain
MEQLIPWVTEHAKHAHWFLFLGTLLAGLNLPLSIDLLLLASATLAARVIPENFWALYLCSFFGCLFSAHIAYWLGRTVGIQLVRWRYFAMIISPARIARIRLFYSKYGLFALIIGRFIPFGVRNSLFMSSGIAKVPFLRFVIHDFCACLIWTTLGFTCFYFLSQHYESAISYLRSFYLLFLIALGLAVIGLIWYKGRKKTTIN